MSRDGKYSGGRGSTKRKQIIAKNATLEFNIDKLKELRANLYNLGMNSVRWGIVDPIQYPKTDKNDRAGMFVAGVLAILEDGCSKPSPKDASKRVITPPRPVFRLSIETVAKPIIKIWAEKTVRSIFNGSYIRDIPIQTLGVELKKVTKETFEDAGTIFGFAPLHPWTYENKEPALQHPTSFFKDSGFMIESIDYSVVLLPVKKDTEE